MVAFGAFCAAAVFTFLCVKETPVEAGLPPLDMEPAAKGATGDHSGAKQSLDSTQQTQTQDASKASEYHDSMHK